MRIAWLDRIGGWNTRLILAASGAVLAAGCAASSGIQVKVSEDGTTTKTLPNNEIRLEGFGKKHRDPTGKSYVETLVYPISGERLLRMSEAESIQMIVNGSSGQVKGTFDGDNFANLRRFVAECVRSAGAGAPPK
jgi:hypothetical protein